MISRSGAENQNSNRWQVREMTTPQIVIPADVMARVANTHARKTAEAQQMIDESLRSAVERRQVLGFFMTIELADDLTDEQIAAACALADDYFGDDDRIDWSAFFDKLDDVYRLCVASDDCGAAQRIQRAVRDHRKAGE